MAQVTARTITSIAEAIKFHVQLILDNIHENHTQQEFELAEELLLDAVRHISAAKISLAIGG